MMPMKENKLKLVVSKPFIICGFSLGGSNWEGGGGGGGGGMGGGGANLLKIVNPFGIRKA